MKNAKDSTPNISFISEISAVGQQPCITLSDFFSLKEFENALMCQTISQKEVASIVDFRNPQVKHGVTLPAALTVVQRVLKLKPWTDEVKILVADREVADALGAYLPPSQRQEATYCTPWGSIMLRVCSITEAGTDAIVNASNPTLTLGGGVSHAIRQAAGNSLQAKMHTFPLKNDGIRLFPGEAVYTFNDGIPGVQYIIHVNAIRGTEDVLTRSIDSCLEISETIKVTSIAFPALGAGTGGMQLRECARIFADRFGDNHISVKIGSLSIIVIALWSSEAFSAFKDAFTNKFCDTHQ